MPYHQRSTAFRSVLGLDTRSNSGVALATAQNVIEWTVINKHLNQDLPQSFNATKTCIGMHQLPGGSYCSSAEFTFYFISFKRSKIIQVKKLEMFKL